MAAGCEKKREREREARARGRERAIDGSDEQLRSSCLLSQGAINSHRYAVLLSSVTLSFPSVQNNIIPPIVPRVEACSYYGGASRTPVAEGGGALWKARRSISPREENGEKTQCGQCAERRQRPWYRAAGRPVTRSRAMPRAIAPQMASKDRNEEYARLKAEFDTMQAEMDALGIGASSKKLEEFEVWRRRRAAKRNHLVGNARRDNSRAIDRAEKAAAAAAASEARSSSANAGPSVRGHSNIPSPHIPSPLLARLTTRSIAQRSGSKTALARLWRVARESVSSLLAAVRQVLPWIEVAHYLDKFGAPRRVSGSRTCARVSVGYRVARTRRRCGTVDLD